MLKQHFQILAALLCFAAALAVACADDETSPTGPTDPTGPTGPTGPAGPGEEELITTIAITLTPVGAGTPVSARFQDSDGEGGNPPVVTDLTVAKNTTYDGRIQVLNESVTPAVDITKEVKEEAENHQFFYEPSGGIADAIVTYTDRESDYGDNIGVDHPVGVTFSIAILQPAPAGKLRVILSHFDERPKDGQTPSDETDIDVTFDVIVE